MDRQREAIRAFLAIPPVSDTPPGVARGD